MGKIQISNDFGFLNKALIDCLIVCSSETIAMSMAMLTLDLFMRDLISLSILALIFVPIFVLTTEFTSSRESENENENTSDNNVDHQKRHHED